MAVADLKPPTSMHGYVDDNLYLSLLTDALEYVPDLAWPQSVHTYSMMRRDPQLAAILAGYTLQLRRASWQLDGRGCRPEVVRQIADDMGIPVAGEDQAGGARTSGMSWNEHLRSALTHLTFGHAGFAMQADVSSGVARLAGVWERPQWTISHIHVDGKTGALSGITQNAAWKEQAPQIRADELVWYAHEREGAAWQGASLLRPAYGPWLIKREMMRTHATANRRWGMGVPVAQALAGTLPTAGQLTEAHRLAAAARAGDQAGAAMPPGFELKIVGMSGSVPDTLAFMKWLDQQMSRMALMGHLDLGETSNGSRALGSTFVDVLMMALESIGEHVADVATRQIAARIAGWNWGADEPVPRVTVSGIGSQREVTAESLNMLLGSGALSADPALEAWVRREYRLPEREKPPASPTPPSPVAPQPRDPAPPPASPPPAAAGRRAPRRPRTEPPGQLALPIEAIS